MSETVSSTVSRTVVIADDHPLFRAALRQAVERVAPQTDVQEASSLASARNLLEANTVTLMLLDLHMEDSSGFAGLLAFRQDFPTVPVVVVSASEEPEVIRRAIHFGASGFIPKSAPLSDMIAALEAVMMGDVWAPAHISLDPQDEEASAAADRAERLASLTPAQMRVLQGVVKGQLNKQIAYDMTISEATVKAHMTAVFRKLGVINRTQAVLAAQDLRVDTDTVDTDRGEG